MELVEKNVFHLFSSHFVYIPNAFVVSTTKFNNYNICTDSCIRLESNHRYIVTININTYAFTTNET